MLLLALAYGGSAAANLLLSVVVGRQLGAAALGHFALAVAVARVSYAASDFGIATHLTRLVARDRTRAGAETLRFLAVRTAVVPLAMLVAVAVGLDAGPSMAVVFALVALALGLVTIQGIYEATLLALAQRRLVACLNAAAAVAVMAACAAWWICGEHLVGFAGGYAAAALLGAVMWAHHSRAHVPLALPRRSDLASTARELRTCWPIGASTVLAIAALRAPVLVLGVFAQPRDVGTFVAIDTFVTAAGILQVAVSNASFARLAASFRTDRAAFRSILWRSNAVLAAIGIATALVITLWGSRLSSTLFSGRDFERVRDIAPIIGWSAPALLLVHHNIYVFAAADSERRNLQIMLVWFVALTGAQLLLVPGYGIAGAAWGLLIGRALGLAALVAMLVRSARRARVVPVRA
ncbi:MAG TPA: oligosaccharide flippase family protein [Kofleriaceae bacterium]|nr:oligosaccharide flippase family protein [Kofleriaceae bacterium]